MPLDRAEAKQLLHVVDLIVQEEFRKRIDDAGIWTQIRPGEFGYSWWNCIYILRHELAADRIEFKVQAGEHEGHIIYTQTLQIEERIGPMWPPKVEALCRAWPDHAEAMRAGRFPAGIVPKQPEVWMYGEFEKDCPRRWSVQMAEPKVQIPPGNTMDTAIKRVVEELFTYLPQHFPQLAGKHVLQPWQLLPRRDASPTRT